MLRFADKAWAPAADYMFFRNFMPDRAKLATAQNYSIVMIASFRFPAIVGTAVVTGTRLRGAAESFCGHNGR